MASKTLDEMLALAPLRLKQKQEELDMATGDLALFRSIYQDEGTAEVFNYLEELERRVEVLSGDVGFLMAVCMAKEAWSNEENLRPN